MSGYKAVFQPRVYEFVRFERLRIVEPYVVGLVLSAALALVLLGVIDVHRSAILRPRSEGQIEGSAQENYPSTAQKLELQIAIRQQLFDGQLTALHNEVEALDRSLVRAEKLLTAVDARLHQQDTATNAKSNQQNADTSAPRDQGMAAVATPAGRQKSDLSAGLHVHEQGSNKRLLAKRRSTKNLVREATHLGLGLTMEIGRGLIVAEVDPGSPAERAGVRQLDLILEVDRTAVNNPDQMSEALLSLKGRHIVRLTVRRAGKTQHVKLSLG
jgi:hypothetical protein